LAGTGARLRRRTRFARRVRRMRVAHSHRARQGQVMDTPPQIGLHHPRIKQLRHVVANTGSNRHRLLAAEGLWAHEVLLDLGVPVDVFLWCPEAAYSPAAQRIATEIMVRARSAYRISERVLARIAERERPDGMVSLVPMPGWTPDTVPLGDD